MLGYYPSHRNWDGAFRQIAVKVNRPGVEVRHRRGYAAFPIGASGRQTSSASAREQALLAEVRQPLEATGIGLTAHVARADPQAGAGQRIAVAIHLDPGAVTLEPQGEKWAGTLDFVIAQHTTDDRWFETEGASLDLDVASARRDQILNEGLRFTRTITMRADADALHVGLRDVASGATGTLTIPASGIRAALRP